MDDLTGLIEFQVGGTRLELFRPTEGETLPLHDFDGHPKT